MSKYLITFLSEFLLSYVYVGYVAPNLTEQCILDRNAEVLGCVNGHAGEHGLFLVDHLAATVFSPLEPVMRECAERIDPYACQTRYVPWGSDAMPVHDPSVFAW